MVIHLPVVIKLNIMHPMPLKMNENACVVRLGNFSMRYHEDKNAGTSTAFTSMKFKYLSPEVNSTEVKERP